PAATLFRRQVLLAGEAFLRGAVQVLVARQQALPGTQARVERQVGHAEDDGAHVEQEPPLGQRVVVFLDAVEGMAEGLFRGLTGLAFAGGEDQPDQRHQTAKGQGRDVPAPEGGHCCVLLAAEKAGRSACSSAKGSWAASAKASRRRALKVQHSTQQKAPITSTVPRPRRVPISINISLMAYLLFCSEVPSTCR